jgi:hypothetical protein
MMMMMSKMMMMMPLQILFEDGYDDDYAKDDDVTLA